MLRFDIIVVPQSGRQQIILDKNGRLKCFILAAPEKNKANKEVIALISKTIKVPQRSIVIAVGALFRKKTIEIDTDMTYEQFLNACGCAQQQSCV